MVSGARREGRKPGVLIKTLSSCLRQAASPCRGEAREGKAYGLRVARNDCVPALPFGRALRAADNIGAYGPPRLWRHAPQAKENGMPGDAGGWLFAVRADSAAGRVHHGEERRPAMAARVAGFSARGAQWPSDHLFFNFCCARNTRMTSACGRSLVAACVAFATKPGTT